MNDQKLFHSHLQISTHKHFLSQNKYSLQIITRFNYKIHFLTRTNQSNLNFKMKRYSFKLICIFLTFFGLFWNCKAGIPPSQKDKGSCDKTIKILNGFSTFVDNGAVVLFECQSGFVPYGEMKANCEKGHWDAKPPTCIKKGCIQPKIPINGKGEEEFSGALIRFSCDSGYKLVGSDEITCNGKIWSDHPPHCTELPPQVIERKPEL